MNVENQEPREGQHPTASGSNGPNVTLIALAVLTAMFVAFFLQNSSSTSIHFLFFNKVTTVRWSILVAVALGIGLDRIFAIWWRRRRKRNEA